jgi:DNA/RNA endonuclease YhcR with UshA esterase domain
VACGLVTGCKRTSANLLINMGSKFPKSELTIVIFNKDKKNFPEDLEGFFRGKNICVAGKPEMYRNKVEMKITSAKEVQIL